MLSPQRHAHLVRQLSVKSTIVVLMLGSMALEAQALTLVPLTPDAANSSQAAFGTDIANLVNDPFAYDPANPTSATPAGIHTDGFHGDEPAGQDVTLIFDFTNGPITLAAGESFNVDLWGRNNCCYDRDDDYDIELYNSGSLVASITGQGIPNSAPYYNRSALGSPGDTFDSLHLIAHDSNGVGDNNFFTPVEIRAFASLPLNPVLTIDRATGAVALVNETGSDIGIIGYSLTSVAGSLSADSSDWTTVTGNYDASPGNGSVDSDDSWTVLTTTPDGTDLSEGELDGGNGGSLASGSPINLGTPWKQTPYEDVVAKILLSDGSINTLDVEYSGVPIEVGDLNGSGVIDANDWDEYVTNAMYDPSGLPAAAAYLAGDLNGDGVNDILDTDLFIRAFESTNGAGSFQAMIAARGVPEPASYLLMGMVAILGAVVLRRQHREISILLLALLAIASFALPTRQAQAIDYTWTGSAGNGDWSNAANWDTNGIPVDDNAGSAGLSVAGVDDSIIFAGSNMPTVNVPDIGGRNAAGTNTPILNLQSGGNLSITSGVGEIGGYITNQVGLARTLFVVGDGVGGANEDVTLNVSHTGALIRHEQQVTHNFVVNSDGTLNFDAGITFSSELSASGRPRYGTFTIDGGLVDAAGPLSNFTVAATGDALAVNNYVDFTSPGGTFTADFGGNLVDLAAVQAAAALGGDGSFRSSAGYSLSITDNADNSFTVEALSQLALLTLQIDPDNGSVMIRNPTGSPVSINSYQISSVGGALDPLGWNSFSDQNLDPIGGGSNPGETWDVVGSGSANSLHEGFLLGSTEIPASGLSIGSAFDESVFGAGNEGDLVFTYRTTDGALIPGLVVYDVPPPVSGDYNGDGVVNLADYTVWRNNLGAGDESSFAPGTGNGGGVDASDYADWKSNFGATASLPAAVRAVPEPSTILLVLAALGSLMLTRTVKTNGVGFMKSEFSMLMRGRLGLATCFLVAWAVVGSTAQAAVSNDRAFLFGDPGSADATLAPPSVDAAANVGNGNTIGFVFNGQSATGDDIGPGGAYLDLIVGGDPRYTDVSGRPGAANGDFGARFDGTDDVLHGTPLNRPDNLSTLVEGYPLNYTGILGHGLQMWVNPAQSALGSEESPGTYQSIVFDTSLSGGPAINEVGQWTQTNSQHVSGADGIAPVPASVDVPAGDTWYHVMHHHQPTSGDTFLSVVYVDGVVVSANLDTIVAAPPANYKGELVVGAAEVNGDNNFETAEYDYFFEGDIDNLEMYVFGDNTSEGGQDWGSFDLFSDNEWIANEIANIPGGVLQPGDVNKDGNVNSSDVDAFIAGWLSVNEFAGAHGTAVAGDWETWGNGDLNHDGMTDLGDLYIMNQALAGAGVGTITADMLAGQAVPEPSSVALITLSGLASWLAWRRR